MKAVLVIDMPDCCNNCLCYEAMEDRSYCNVLNEDMCFASCGRLGNCPLRPLSEKKEIDITLEFGGYENIIQEALARGYNAYYDEITGETE